MPIISNRTAKLIQSDIRTMSIECEKIGAINLSQGMCDLEIPRPVIKAAKSTIEKGVNHYTRYDGILELRQAIAKKMKKYNNMNVDPEKNIIVTSGATGAFYAVCLALLNPKDEVILFEPYYGYHLNTLLAAEARAVFVKMVPPTWSFSKRDLEKVITKKTKAIVINTPANPSGKVFTHEELNTIAEIAVRFNLFIFTDEIYEYFIYDKRKHISPGSLPAIKDRTITIGGYSKAYSITGWRIGYCICNEKLKEPIGFMSDLIYVCAPAPLQKGVSHGINSISDDYYEKLCELFEAKRDKLCRALEKSKLPPIVPQGAYYVLADTSNIPGETSRQKALYLLKKSGVASVPGSAFYHDSSGENFVRFCFAVDDRSLDHAIKRLLSFSS